MRCFGPFGSNYNCNVLESRKKSAPILLGWMNTWKSGFENDGISVASFYYILAGKMKLIITVNEDQSAENHVTSTSKNTFIVSIMLETGRHQSVAIKLGSLSK